MKYFLILFSLLPQMLQAQIITNYASGPAIYDPNGLAFDANRNLYVTTLLGCTIVKVDTSGIIAAIAGTGTAGFSGDGGPAINAQLNQPLGLTLDTSGNIFFADVENQRIRKIDAVTGLISTIAGTGIGGYSTGGFSGDGGPASAAQLNDPSTICFDELGNLYIADVQNYRIRKINTSGIISTIAGNGILGDSGDGGLAINAEIYPTCMCVDNIGNLYISSYGVVGSGCKVRKIDTSGIIITIASDSASCSYNGDGIPATSAKVGAVSLATHNGLLYLSDACNNRVRFIDRSGIIHTVAGDGLSGDSGDGGDADSSELDNQYGITFDQCGNLYIAQIDSPCIRKVAFNPDCWPEKVPQVAINEPTIYPNPAFEVLNVDNVTTAERYAIINITGIIEQKGTLKAGSNSIQVQSLPPGIYLLQTTDTNGTKTIHKIVKE